MSKMASLNIELYKEKLELFNCVLNTQLYDSLRDNISLDEYFRTNKIVYFLCANNHPNEMKNTSFHNKHCKLKKALKENANTHISICATCDKKKTVSKKYADIEKICKTKGLILLECKNTKDITYKCGNCGAVNHTNLSAIKKRTEQQCPKCQNNKNRNPWDKVVDYFKKAGVELLSNPDEYKSNTSDLRYKCICGREAETTFHTISRHLNNNIQTPFGCSNCHNFNVAMTLSDGEYTNVARMPETKENTRITNKRLYGDHPMRLKEFRDKASATCMENYNVAFGFCRPEVYKKIRETCLFRYDVEYPLQNPIILSRVRETCKKNWGTDYPFQSKKFWKYWGDRLEKEYGVRFYTQTKKFKEQFKETCIERFGVEHPMKNYEVFKKCMKSCFQLKDYKFDSGKIMSVMGYEDSALNILLGKSKTQFDDFKTYTEEDIIIEPENPSICYEDEKGVFRTYYPDIFVREGDKLKVIEVKSVFTFNKQLKKNICKFKEAGKVFDIFEVWVIDRHGSLINIISFNKFGEGTYPDGFPYDNEEIGKRIEGNRDELDELFVDSLDDAIEVI